MKFKKHLALFLVLIAGVYSVSSVAGASSKPNIIMIYADDLGIGMLGCYGQKLVKTPNIDRLAAEGMKFNNYYGGVFCAPARWTLASGMHDGRLGGWKQNRAGLPVKRDAGKISEAEYKKKMKELKANAWPIPEEEVFLAQVAQKAGYATAQFGKLDRGFLTWAERVDRFGWDFHEGYYDHMRCHGFYPPYLWRNGERFDLPGNNDPYCKKVIGDSGSEKKPSASGKGTYSQEVFIEGILKFIREHKEERFFLHHPTQLPHGPVAIPEIHADFVDHPTLSMQEKKYASMVKMLDDHVGLIMRELKLLGLDENTVVFFTSDNGHELYYGPKSSKHKRLPNGEASNLTDKKWRTSECGDVFDGAGGRAGTKRSGYQGGMQCPMIVRWPGKISPGTETDLLSAHYDFLATLAEIGNVSVPAGKDSVSYLPTLLGKPQQSVHEYVIVNNGFNQMGRSALIARDGWKLVELNKEKGRFQLYNLNDDNEERHELSKEHPERVERLKQILSKEIDSTRPDLTKG